MYLQKLRSLIALGIALTTLQGCQSDYLNTDTDETSDSSNLILSTDSNALDSEDSENETDSQINFTNAQPDSDSDTQKTIVSTHLIENFDDGDITNELGGIWLTYDDQYDGGNSVVLPASFFEGASFTSEAPGYLETGYAAHVSGTTGNVFGWDYLGLFSATSANAVCPDAQAPSIDFTLFDGIQFMAKGTTVPFGLHFKLPHKKTGPTNNCTHNSMAPDSLTEYNDFEYDFGAQLTDDWQLIRIAFSDMERRSNPEGLTIEEVLSTAKEFIWEYQKSNGEVDFWIDDIAFYSELE